MTLLRCVVSPTTLWRMCGRRRRLSRSGSVGIGSGAEGRGADGRPGQTLVATVLKSVHIQALRSTKAAWLKQRTAGNAASVSRLAEPPVSWASHPQLLLSVASFDDGVVAVCEDVLS